MPAGKPVSLKYACLGVLALPKFLAVNHTWLVTDGVYCLGFLKILLFSPGYNRTFTVSLERAESHQLKEVAFMNLGRLLLLLPYVTAILCPP